MLRYRARLMNDIRTPRFSLHATVLVLALAASALAQQEPPTKANTDGTTADGTVAALTPSYRPAPIAKKSLYDRLGGVFAISAVIDHFSDALIENPMVGRHSKNPALRKWSTEHLDRLPGLKFMRTMWVCTITGGPFKYTATVPGKTKLGLEKAHQTFQISSEEFNEVAAELGRTLDFFKVPKQEKGEVLAAFAAHKQEVLGGR